MATTVTPCGVMPEVQQDNDSTLSAVPFIVDTQVYKI